MLSGTLTPSTANVLPRLKNLNIKDDPQPEDATAATEKASNDTSGRSAALERAYVHDVYENCDEPSGSIRPKVAQFLAGLEPGSMVCDVGCGNGRYLNACNPLIFTLGVDRCYRLAKVARAKGGDVSLCDNLELPFRDESFDAALSVAVVHHFATTERRVGAIRELARILRIGGRVIITVWALEQKQRRFESQDVLIPWQPPKSRNSNFSDDEDDDEFLPPYHAYTEDSTNSSRSAGDGDSSSLSSSSPGESCYSFVRRAIQKLAGGKRHPWFLEPWNSKDTKNGSSLDYEDAKDLPIELRRLEDFEDFPDPPLSAGLKSRSLGSILNPPPRQIVRSRSSVPSLGAQMAEKRATPPVLVEARGGCSTASSTVGGGGISGGRPKLVKQKQSLCDDDFVIPESGVATTPPTTSSTTTTTAMSNRETRLFLRKQSSLNEELMAENRIREKEKVKKRIQKQMSLNEAYLCRSLFSRRLQVIREGLTTKLKTSTGSLERVTKCGLVKIMQNLKGTHNSSQATGQMSEPASKESSHTNASGHSQTYGTTGGGGGGGEETVGSVLNGVASSAAAASEEEQKVRRHSRESGSDSSKDSLQSDTSIESEDSFASVIYIPRPDQCGSNNKTPSVPTSPLVMPCPTPAQSPAPARYKVQQQPFMPEPSTRFTFEEAQLQKSDDTNVAVVAAAINANRCTTTKAHIAPKETIGRPPLAPTTKPKAPSKSSPKFERITKQIVKNLPQIPKFRRPSHFALVHRHAATGAPIFAKLAPMDIFNPETDDLDSDSSEPSSPDSIDSVINALKPTNEDASPEDDLTVPELEKDPEIITTTTTTATTIITPDETSSIELVINQNMNHSYKLLPHPIVVMDNSSKTTTTTGNGEAMESRRTDLADFAEMLRVRLLKQLDGSSEALLTEDGDANITDMIISDSFEDPYIRKLNGEIRDLNLMREEMRERRLMLANLNTSTSSTIHEEDESPSRHDDDDDEDDEVEDHEASYRMALFIKQQKQLHEERKANAPGTDSLDDDTEPIHASDREEFCQHDDIASIINSNDNLNVSASSQLRSNNNIVATATVAAAAEEGIETATNRRPAQLQPRSSTESRQSGDSWAHSNSTASLDSPSVGGSSTHHRYYHVFREGELDALINHHVASLHIVSSYYERASWCVVAEKVQVWTI